MGMHDRELDDRLDKDAQQIDSLTYDVAVRDDVILKLKSELAEAAQDVKQAEYNLRCMEEMSTNPTEIVELLTFENSHEVAYHLYHSDAVAAQALMNELLYWVNR